MKVMKVKQSKTDRKKEETQKIKTKRRRKKLNKIGNTSKYK
jgi:hypothetical protein